ncbi:MAG: N,N-dimethylformamidase large subunit [Rhodospirillales bacterium]|nr:N,N-dimethylformamidase large subunit [Rhodospirillales bacterium]
MSTHAPPPELPITGYLDRMSCRPGGGLAVKVSVRDASSYRVRLQRLISGDPNPAGPGLRFEDLSALYDQTHPGRRQPVRRGSYARVPAGPPRDGAAACTWSALIAPGRIDREQAVLWESGEGCTVTIGHGPQGASARLTWPGGAVALQADRALARQRFHRIWLAADPGSGRVLLGVEPLEQGHRTTATAVASGLRLPSGGGPVLVAAADAEGPDLHFSGKIERPAIHAGAHETFPDARGALALWDFAIGIEGTAITDTGPHGCHGQVVNMPTRGMVGAFWSGREVCWRHAPADYAAIGFHADDLNDCGWETDFTFTPPAGLRSGCYLLHLSCEAGEDWIPFYLLPPREGPHAAIVFLASTFTYIAYANHARGNADAAYKQRVQDWGAYRHNADDTPLYGRSTYNLHDDGSGISLSSRLRPILTMRPGYLTFNDARGSGLRHFPADTHLLAWLEDKGIAYDVVTDEDLDDEGLAALRPYRAVLTGSHPEYHTPRMLDALESYTHQGGRLCYLGGNGFYWRIARSPALPHTIEVRRAEGGIRAWAAEPGEYFNQLDGALGGLWRRSRRPPQRLVGVGFSGQGLFEGTYYRRLPASHDPAHAWIFEGIEEEVIGDYGLSGGGAAGFEFDRADPALGTPEGTVILARSENPPRSVTVVPEELLSHVSTLSGERPDALKRAEIVYFRTPGDGEVFSTGSITFCGSLWRDGAFQGPVSRLLENVVRRFARPG